MKLLLRLDLKADGVPWTNKHLLDLERKGKFPRRVYLGERTPAWRADEYAAWKAARIAERDSKQAA